MKVIKRLFDQQGAYATFDFGALRNGYGWIFPKSDHLSVGILQTNDYKSTDLNLVLKNFIACQAVLQECTVLKLKGHLIPMGGKPEILHNNRVLLIGDAANLADPWLGEGLFYAISSARIAAEVLLNLNKKGTIDLSAYTTRINQEIISQFRYAKAFAKFVYKYPQTSSKIISKSPLMQNIVFNAISGKLSYQQLNRKLLNQLPAILLQALSGKEESSEA